MGEKNKGMRVLRFFIIFFDVRLATELWVMGRVSEGVEQWVREKQEKTKNTFIEDWGKEKKTK